MMGSMLRQSNTGLQLGLDLKSEDIDNNMDKLSAETEARKRENIKMDNNFGEVIERLEKPEVAGDNDTRRDQHDRIVPDQMGTTTTADGVRHTSSWAD